MTSLLRRGGKRPRHTCGDICLRLTGRNQPMADVNGVRWLVYRPSEWRLVETVRQPDLTTADRVRVKISRIVWRLVDGKISSLGHRRT